ncbi:MAG: hypothetical protein Q8P93_01920 [bacterium]|nr:hypothetical protein [bacterium]
MNEEKNSSTITGVVIGIIILVLVVLGLVAWNRTADADTDDMPANEEQTNNDSASDQQATLVSYTYEDGVHIYTGMIKVPTPCHTLTHEVVLTEEAPIVPTINFTINQPQADAVCAQVITEVPFTVEFRAPENSARAEATLDGNPFFLIVGGKE